MQPYYTFAFYNVENLFDTIDDPHTFDDDFTPEGSRNWTPEKYQNKLGKLGKAISEIGLKDTGFLPTIIGLAEVENKKVLDDLLQISHLQNTPYKYVHFDSQDERGVDVALLYNAKEFILEHAEPILPPRFIEEDKEDFTRDVLYVKGSIQGEVFHFFVVHLPSQRNQNINLEKRNQIAQKIKEKVDYILLDDPNALVTLFGDFNSNPNTETLQKFFKTTSNPNGDGELQFYNPMELLAKNGQYTTKHRQTWILYDQILFSRSFLDYYPTPRLMSTEIFNPYFLQEWNRKYKGQPFRTFVGRKYLGGYSDHFPIYSVIKI